MYYKPEIQIAETFVRDLITYLSELLEEKTELSSTRRTCTYTCVCYTTLVVRAFLVYKSSWMVEHEIFF